MLPDTTLAWIRGKSLLVSPSKNRRPSPGQLKIVSTITDPPTTIVTLLGGILTIVIGGAGAREAALHRPGAGGRGVAGAPHQDFPPAPRRGGRRRPLPPAP